MSQENVEWIERFWELYNRREIDAWVELMAPDVEWHVDPEDPDTAMACVELAQTSAVPCPTSGAR